MLVVVALVLALTLLENKPLALDLLSLNSAKDINIKAGYETSFAWL
jgi:hypothetical protein